MGPNEPAYYDTTGIHFGTPTPSETSLCFFDDGRLLAVTRARGHCALLSTSEPPYDQWERYLSRESRCYGSAIARVGERVIVTGRSFANEGVRATENRFNDKFSDHDQSQLRTGVFLYEDGDIHLHTVLPSGGDTGYGSILPISDNQVLIAYYSSHEYAPGDKSRFQCLPSLSITDVSRFNIQQGTTRIPVKRPSTPPVNARHQHEYPSVLTYYTLPSISMCPTWSPVTTPDLCR